MTLTGAIRDARARAIFGKAYATLTPAQQQTIDRLMQSGSKYQKGQSK